MEIILLVVLIGMVLWLGNKLSDQTRQINYRLDGFFKELSQLKSDIEAARKPAIIPKEEIITPEISIPPVIIEPEKVIFPESQPEIVKIIQKRSRPEVEPLLEAVVEPPQILQPQVEEARPSFFENFLKNNPDLEKFIGENLINKIGIAILVLGIGYFVKFAIDKDWINEIGRVGIGILAGGILIGLAHRLRNKFAAFSSVLVGGGLAVLYFTIAIAFHQYHIFSQTAAFVLMVLITGFSILLSVSYNRVELAVLSILGGFATPFMVSTGSGNYQVLFTYILILNVGMLVLAYLKKWNIINWIAYVFTIILYGGWLETQVVGVVNPPLQGALMFGTLFYIVFFLMNVINNIRQQTKFAPAEITILLSNTFLYYSAGMVILAEIRGGLYQGLFTVCVAVFNCIFAFVLYKNRNVDRNLIYLLIGLVITFISLAVPVQLEGNYITMFWALEAVLLLWLSQKSGLKLVAVSSVLVTGLMLISLVMDWRNIYTADAVAHPLPVLLNKAFITSLIAIISLFVNLRLLRQQTEAFDFTIFELEILPYKQVVQIVVGLTIYIAGLLELNYQLLTYIDSAQSRTIIVGCYNLIFINGVYFYTRRTSIHLSFVLILSLIGIVLYLAVYNPAVMELLRMHFTYDQQEFIGFSFHYISLIAVVLLVMYGFRYQTIFDEYIQVASTLLLWFLCAVVVYIASAELLYHVLYFNLSGTVVSSEEAMAGRMNSLITQTAKVGFPILWGICAFTLMFIGLSQKNKDLRIISLSLFTLTLLKLFIYDIRGISEGGKIAAFISLGVLLLVISFMYQNLKRIILADENAVAGEESKK